MNKTSSNHKKDNLFYSGVFDKFSTNIPAIVLLFAGLLILARIYSPVNFGFLALFICLSMSLAYLAIGRYYLAVQKKKSIHLSVYFSLASLIPITFMSGISLFLVAFIKIFLNGFNTFIRPSLFYLLPISVFLNGCLISLNIHYSRTESSNKLALIKSIGYLAIILSAIIFHKSGFGSNGLISGYLVGTFIVFCLLVILKSNFYSQIIKKYSRELFKQEVNSPKNYNFYAAPLLFMNFINNYLPVFVISGLYDFILSGLYSIAIKFPGYPLTIVTQSYNKWFRITKNKKKNINQLHISSSILNSFIVASIVTIPFILWGNHIFSFLLGPEWKYTGDIVRILAPLIISHFTVIPIKEFLYKNEFYKTLLVSFIVYLIIATATLIAGSAKGFEKMMMNYSIIASVMNIIFAMMAYEIYRRMHLRA